MSAKSSDSHREEVAERSQKSPRLNHWKMLVVLPLWVGLAFLVSNLAVAYTFSLLELFFHVSLESYFRPAILQTTLATIIYALTIAIVIFVPYRWGNRTNLQTLGLHRLPSWSDIGLAPVAFVLYTFIVAIVLALVSSWLPGIPLDQTQDIGFKALGTRLDNMLAFITLVVMAPLAEETLFRGYLYGKLKKYVPAIYAAIATSLLFGLAHFQLNVGIDVFVLSLILCGLRSLTGSIWAGILVHMVKNALAYYLLFVKPLIGG